MALGLRIVNNKNKAVYTEEEDFTIEDLVEEKGRKWKEIALAFPGRSEKDIMNRYHSPHRRRRSCESNAKHKEHRKWTAAEDQTIRDGIVKHGRMFTEIAKLLGEDRDGAAVKNRANSAPFLRAATGSDMAAAASVPATLTNDESMVVVTRAAKKVKFTIPPSFVDGEVAAAASVPPPTCVDGGVTGVLNDGSPPLELSLSYRNLHAEYDSFVFKLSDVDIDEYDDTITEYLSEAV